MFYYNEMTIETQISILVVFKEDKVSKFNLIGKAQQNSVYKTLRYKSTSSQKITSVTTHHARQITLTTVYNIIIHNKKQKEKSLEFKVFIIHDNIIIARCSLHENTKHTIEASVRSRYVLLH